MDQVATLFVGVVNFSVLTWNTPPTPLGSSNLCLLLLLRLLFLGPLPSDVTSMLILHIVSSLPVIFSNTLVMLIYLLIDIVFLKVGYIHL